jgi:hypothetical protein
MTVASNKFVSLSELKYVKIRICQRLVEVLTGLPNVQVVTELFDDHVIISFVPTFAC